MFDIITLLPIDPTSLITPIFTIMCYTGALGTECKAQPDCLSVKNSYSCYQRNFGDIHTPEYMKAIREGKNVKARIKDSIIHKKERKAWEIF
jgi:hypothetical protein